MREVGLAHRSPLHKFPDHKRVISRLFIPGQEIVGGSESRTEGTIARVLALSESDVTDTLAEIMVRFSERHVDLPAIFEEHAAHVFDREENRGTISPARRQLLGAAFTHEYSIEGAAVCNPSLVAHFDQSDVEPGALRVISSFRSIGEGHVSSISFRVGMIGVNGDLAFDDPEPFPIVAAITTSTFLRTVFRTMLSMFGADRETTALLFNQLPEEFSAIELEHALTTIGSQGDTRLEVLEASTLIRSVALCFYTANFERSVHLSRRVLWPATVVESHGVEDARFVKFMGDETCYVASYTAFDGRNVSQQLLETEDFCTFTSTPMTGIGARNKGLAIFPRKINGQYLGLSRHDRETNSLASSDDLYCWEHVCDIQSPTRGWELLQMGNCGSPIELDEGWLVIIHGVGAMRTYGIGALLLDLEHPEIVLAHLPGPLLIPCSSEQDGYVPNVVYSCGSLVHNGTLYLPHGIADGALGHVTVSISELLSKFVNV